MKNYNVIWDGVAELVITSKGKDYAEKLPPLDVLKWKMWKMWKTRSLWWRFIKIIKGKRLQKPYNYRELIKDYDNANGLR